MKLTPEIVYSRQNAAIALGVICLCVGLFLLGKRNETINNKLLTAWREWSITRLENLTESELSSEEVAAYGEQSKSVDSFDYERQEIASAKIDELYTLRKEGFSYEKHDHTSNLLENYYRNHKKGVICR